jgi:hypothetical protein
VDRTGPSLEESFRFVLFRFAPQERPGVDPQGRKTPSLDSRFAQQRGSDLPRRQDPRAKARGRLSRKADSLEKVAELLPERKDAAHGLASEAEALRKNVVVRSQRLDPFSYVAPLGLPNGRLEAIRHRGQGGHDDQNPVLGAMAIHLVSDPPPSFGGGDRGAAELEHDPGRRPSLGLSLHGTLRTFGLQPFAAPSYGTCATIRKEFIAAHKVVVTN